MTIFRNKNDGQLYNLYKVTPRFYTGGWHEAENLFTKEKRKLNQSSFKKDDFIPVAHA